MRQITARQEVWPIAGSFVIARGSKTEAKVIVVELAQDGFVGRGESVPYGRYDETIERVLAQIEQVSGAVAGGMDCNGLMDLLPAGAARNALDCALWDLQAKQSGIRAHLRAGFTRLDPVKTAYTISLGTPQTMAKAASAAAVLTLKSYPDIPQKEELEYIAYKAQFLYGMNSVETRRIERLEKAIDLIDDYLDANRSAGLHSPDATETRVKIIKEITKLKEII